MSAIAKVLEHYGFNVPPAHRKWQPLLCAFHGEQHASAAYSAELGGFRCHSCGITGDAIKLIRDQEGLSFAEAREFARDRLGIGDEFLPGDDRPGGSVSASSRLHEGNGRKVPTRLRPGDLFGGI